MTGDLRRLIVWSGADAWRAEAASVDLAATGLRGGGTQIGTHPEPYRIDYELDAAGEGFVTRVLAVTATGSGWTRHLRLEHDGEGGWSCATESDGSASLPPPGGDAGAVTGALDCDLGRCPLTNTMPVLRHGLHRRPGAVDFLMAWVSVPDLGLHPSRQRYEHVRAEPERSVVRYVGAHRDFVGELVLDRDGLVIEYPELARRAG